MRCTSDMPPACESSGWATAEREQRAFARGVGGAAGDADPRVERRCRHHRAAAGARFGQDGAEAEEGAGEVDGEPAFPGGEGRLVRGADVHGAGVAAEDTDGTVAVGGGHDAVPVALFGDVRPYGVGAAPLSRMPVRRRPPA